ncbi:L-seryl-tRNA(Sec) kinase, putative [Plasmodium vinckei brucechwatti]|uniref:L-seryl-tRNA(Sec) kinase, putative n=1 Tax=Plasmodium vinckei brucechwatti TaxID=119398 RepID=A0A6V7RUG2_PLAVN|nr:L-seryl-tRNA(Sec) kinase, putative [Plasmodium vinckei brucechwatti]
MDHRQKNDIFSWIIFFIKNNNTNDDLISVKNIYNHIKKNNITPNIVNPLDKDRNIFYSLFSIIYNKIKIYIHLLKNKKYDNDSPNFLPKNYINSTYISNDYIKTYDILYSPKCYVTIEYFIKTLSLCVPKLNIKDEDVFFFSGINIISSLLDLYMAEKENTPTNVDKNDKILNTEGFHLIVIKYIKNIFKYIYPHNAFEGINEASSASQTNIASYKSNNSWNKLDKQLDTFFCLLNIIRILLEFIINKNNKIKLKSLKLLYIIHKKIKNTYIIKKIFKGVSLNLFILYKSINIKKIKNFILKIFTISIDRILKYYLSIENDAISQYLKRDTYILCNLNELSQHDDFIKMADLVMKQCVLSKKVLNGNLEQDKSNFEKKFISLNVQLNNSQRDSTYFSNNIDIVEEKNVISNIYFICYYILINYNYNEYKNDVEIGDDLCEILDICKVLIKYYTILNRNLVLISFFFILSQMFYDKDINFLPNMNFVFNNKISQYFEEPNLAIHQITNLTNIFKNIDKTCKDTNLNQHTVGNETNQYVSSNHIRSARDENKKMCFENMENSVNTINMDTQKDESFPIQFGNQFQNDLYKIFLNFIKNCSEKKDEILCHNEINNSSLDQLNYNIEHYYFKYLYNIFLLKKENNIFIFNFLRGYIYYTFINYNLKMKNIIHFSKHINSCLIFNFLLNLYEISDISPIHNKNYQPVQTNMHSIVLSENNSFYNIDIYNNSTLSIIDNTQELSNSFNFTNLLTLINLKNSFKHQPVSLINEVTIFSFLACDNNQAESYINDVLFSELEIKNGEDIKNGGDIKNVDEHIMRIKQRCKAFHFINYYLDFLIILLWVKTKLTGKDNKHVPYFEERLETEFVKNILVEYSTIFNNYFSLAVIIKLTNFKLNIQKGVENIICLCFEKIKENEIWKEKKNDLNYYYISLLIICINKSFLILYLTNLDEVIKKYFYKNLVFFLLNINNESNSIKQLSAYFLFATHKYLSNNEEGKDKKKNQNAYNHELIQIIGKYQDIITSYIYKKIINIESVDKCMKIFKLIKMLIFCNYSNVYIYKDICINIIKITKKKTNEFIFLNNKNIIIANILNIFNYILYLLYKIVYQNRTKILAQQKYMSAIKDKILDGYTYININDLKSEINKKNTLNSELEINPDNNLSSQNDEVDTPQQCFVKNNKKKTLLHNYFFFKNMKSLSSLTKETKTTFLNTVEDFYKNIKSLASKNINYHQVINLVVDDDCYDTVNQNNDLGSTECTDQNVYSTIRFITSHIFNFAKTFFCHDDELIQYSAQLCILQCLFIFSTRRFELYTKTCQILNYVSIIDDAISIERISKDIIPALCLKLKKFDIKNGLPKYSQEYRFLEKAMQLFLTLSKIEKCYDKTYSSILFLCLSILNKLYDDQIKNISLNIISNLFITNIPRMQQMIESIRKIKERINYLYNGNILTKKIINKMVFKQIINDIEIVEPLSFLSCLFMSEELKEIVFLIISIDYNIICFLIFYFEVSKFNLKNEKWEDNFTVKHGAIYLNKKQKYNKKEITKIKKILKNENKGRRQNYTNSSNHKIVNNNKHVQNLEKTNRLSKKLTEQNGGKKRDEKIVDTKKNKKKEKILNMFDKDLNQSLQKLNIKTRKFEIHKNKQSAKTDISENEILQKILTNNRERKADKVKETNKPTKSNNLVKLAKPSKVKEENETNETSETKEVDPKEPPNYDQSKSDELVNKLDIRKILKIGKSIDGFRKEIEIKNDVPAEFESQAKRLNLFSAIVDFNANAKGEVEDEKGKENDEEEEESDENQDKITKADTFKNIGIYDNFINVYLKYNNIDNPTFYQKKIIPIIMYFLNNASYDLMRCINESSIEENVQTQDEKAAKQIIYINKYNNASKNLIRTFFLHCPTGTGKTFMYLLPIFQQITNLKLSENVNQNCETKQVDNDKEKKNEIFYKSKQINGVTSFCCSDQVNIDFIDKNYEILKNNILNYVLDEEGNKSIPNNNNKNEQTKVKQNDILILTYNKEVAVQIYELYKDIINSFYKSYASKFFEINKSLTQFEYINEQQQEYLEKINILYKSKINMNVHLLIGGNNIKYQLKSLRKPKINITKEGEENNSDIININIYVGTPGRVHTIINEKKTISLENVHTIIFDEYDFFFSKFESDKVEKEEVKNKVELENTFFSQILKSIYTKKTKKKTPSITNVICCSATSAIYPYLLYTKHFISERFLTSLLGKNIKQENQTEQPTDTSPINYEREENIINSLFKIEETIKVPNNLIHFNYCYNKKSQIKNNNAMSNFLKILFSNPLNKNVLVFCNTKKRVMDLWSLFRNKFDVDIQTIFSRNEKRKKKIFKDINYANFSKNDLINYKNLKKYVNFLFISTNLLYRGINCIGFTTIINFDMPLNNTEYVHRCGRIGRVNNKGAIFNIFEEQDKKKYMKQIFNKINIKPFDIDCPIYLSINFFSYLKRNEKMNFLFMFYGPPCSGKDTLINFLIKKKKKILFFVYLLYNLKKENISYKYSYEKVFFIQLIKYCTKINNNNNAARKISISFLSLIYLYKTLFIASLGDSPFRSTLQSSLNAVYNKIKNVKKEKKANKTKQLCVSLHTHSKNAKHKYVHNNNQNDEHANKSNITKMCIKISKKKILSRIVKPKTFFIFYKKFAKHFQHFLSKYKNSIHNISPDYIEKQFYSTKNKKRHINQYKKIKKNEKNNIAVVTNKIFIFEKQNPKTKIYYPNIKKRCLKNKLFFLSNIRKNKNIKPTLINQKKYWKIARQIAYLYCYHLINQNDKEKSHTKYNKNKIIILNDTFHFPSMRKKYYLLSKKYNSLYTQTFLNTPSKTCVKLNINRDKFKYISNETIIKNCLYHNKYAIKLKKNEQKNISRMINLVKATRKWQANTISIQVNRLKNKNKLTELLFFIYKYFETFIKEIKKEKTAIKKENPNPVIQTSVLEIINKNANKIIHEKLKNIPNDQKNVYAQKYRLIKLQLLKEYRIAKNCNIKDIESRFTID